MSDGATKEAEAADKREEEEEREGEEAFLFFYWKRQIEAEEDRAR